MIERGAIQISEISTTTIFVLMAHVLSPMLCVDGPDEYISFTVTTSHRHFLICGTGAPWLSAIICWATLSLCPNSLFCELTSLRPA